MSLVSCSNAIPLEDRSGLCVFLHSVKSVLLAGQVCVVWFELSAGVDDCSRYVYVCVCGGWRETVINAEVPFTVSERH